MAKQSRGLPADFAFEVAPDAGQEARPVRLKGYLHQEFTPVVPAVERTESRPLEVVHTRAVPEPPTTLADTATQSFDQPQPVQTNRSARRRPALRRGPRKEISLDAEAIRKLLEVVDDICDQGPQPDATASELVRALAQLAHDARHKADYMHLNRRGQWGSATAKAFIADVKEAFLRAVGQLYVDRYPGEVRQQLEAAP